MPCDMRYKAVIFDMDGTILDTSGDLTAAVNYAMAKFGHRSDFPTEDGCLFFGSGAHTAIQRALAREAGMDRDEILKIGSAKNSVVPGIDEDEVLRILEVYQPYYKAHNAILTSAYPGITDLLKKLRSAGVRTAVVSNKPDNSVTQLAEDYFGGLFDLAIGETEGIARKPAPDMNCLILDKLGVDVSDAVYVGDTEIDRQSAEKAGVSFIWAKYGFGHDIAAKYVLNSITELPQVIGTVL